MKNSPQQNTFKFSIFIIALFLVIPIYSQGQTAKEIIEKADEKMRGTTSYSEITITTVRPKWQKEMTLKTWTQGSDYSVSVVLSPAKEKGSVSLYPLLYTGLMEAPYFYFYATYLIFDTNQI